MVDSIKESFVVHAASPVEHLNDFNNLNETTSNQTATTHEISKEISEEEIRKQEQERIKEQDRKAREYKLKRDQLILNELIKHEDKNFNDLVEQAKQKGESLDSQVIDLRTQFNRLAVKEMQDTAMKLDLIQSTEASSSSLDKKRLASEVFPDTLDTKK
jgi:hypothetical protein